MNLVEKNILIHDKVAKKYDALHGEIFNDIEQARLLDILKSARALVASGATPLRALDFGCGSGNLTKHLLALGMEVTAADVSENFLRLVRHRYHSAPLDTLRLNGRDLSNVADESFDLIATYSVLHHIPDYLAAVSELARVCKPGGAIVIDHEQNERFWTADPIYADFRRAALRTDWGKFLRPSNYVHKVRRLFDPRHTNEGDIHVWPDDHIEWDRIRDTLARQGCTAVKEQDYLLSRKLYRPEVYERYRDRCTDMKVMVFRKQS